MNAPFQRITVESINAQLAAAREQARNRRLARELLALGEACIKAAGKAGIGQYEDTATEAAVTNAAYDLFECDALYERVRDIDPDFYERSQRLAAALAARPLTDRTTEE